MFQLAPVGNGNFVDRDEPREDQPAPTDEERRPTGGPTGGVNVSHGWTPERDRAPEGPSGDTDEGERPSETVPAGE